MSTIDLNLSQFTRSRLVNGTNDSSLVNITYTYTIPLPRDGSNNIIRDGSRNANAVYRLVGSFTEDTRVGTPSNRNLNFTNQIRIFTERLPQLSGARQNFNVKIDLNEVTLESPLYISATTQTGDDGKFRNITMVGSGTFNNGIYFYVGAKAITNAGNSILNFGTNTEALSLECKMNCLINGSTQPTGLMGSCTIEGYGNLIVSNDNTVINITSFPKISNFGVGGSLNVTKNNDPRINYIINDTFALLKYKEDAEEEENTTSNKQIPIDVDYTGSLFKNFTDSQVLTLNEMTTIHIYGPYHSDENTGEGTTNGSAIVITYINEPTVKLAIRSSEYEGSWTSQNGAGVIIAESKINGKINVDVSSDAVLQFQGSIFNNDLSCEETPLTFTGTGEVYFAGGYSTVDGNLDNTCYPAYNMINAVSTYKTIVNTDDAVNINFDNYDGINQFYVNLPSGYSRHINDYLETPIFQLTNTNFSNKELDGLSTYNFGVVNAEIKIVFPYNPNEEELTAKIINTTFTEGANITIANNYYVSLYGDETQLTENIEESGDTSSYIVEFDNFTDSADSSYNGINSTYQLKLYGEGEYLFTSASLDLSQQNIIPIVMHDTCSLRFADNGITFGYEDPKYIVESHTTGNSIITLGDNIITCTGGVHVYWPTLGEVTSSKPLNSKTNKYYATDFEPTTTVTVNHGTDGYYSHEELICRCTPGFEDTNWTGNVGSSLYCETIDLGQNSYDGTDVFTNNTFATSFYGSLDGTNARTRLFEIVSSIITETITFANSSTSYLGDATMKLNMTTGTDYLNSFGVGPLFTYEIIEDSPAPTLTFEDEVLRIVSFGQTIKTVSMELSKSVGVELYVYPYLGSNSDILDIARIFKYKNTDAQYKSYDDYLDDESTDKLIKLNIGTTTFNFLVNYDYEQNRSYAIGKELYFDLSPAVPTGEGNPLIAFETDGGISVENYGPLNYPVISLTSEYDFINNGNIEDGVDNDIDTSGNLNESTENDPLVVVSDDVGEYQDETFTYTKRYYIGMFIETLNDVNHVLTISGSSSQYTYSYQAVDGSPVVDNNDGTATMTFASNNHTLFPVDITVTAIEDPNSYYIGVRENFKIVVSDSAPLVGLNDAEEIESVPTYLRSEFYFPIVVETRFDELDWQNSGTHNTEVGLDTSVLLSVKIVGTADTEMDVVFTMDTNNEGFWLYDGTNEIRNELVMTLNAGSGPETTTQKTIRRYNNNYIIGAGSTDTTPTITLVPSTVNNLSFLQTIDSLTLSSVAADQLNHIMTYNVRLEGDHSTYTSYTSANTGDTEYVAQPLQFIEPTVDPFYAFATVYNSENYSYFGGRIEIVFNSVPYDISNGSDYPIDIHYVVSVSTNGTDWEELPEEDFIVRDVDFNIVSPTVGINRDTYNSPDGSNVRYISVNERYNFVRVAYYATDYDSNSTINDECDYYYLPSDAEDAVNIAEFNYSNKFSVEVDSEGSNDGGTYTTSRTKGSSVTIHVGTYGICLENTDVVFDISTTTAAFTIGNTESIIRVTIAEGESTGSAEFTIYNNREYIAGSTEYIRLTPAHIENGTNSTPDFTTLDYIQINDDTDTYIELNFEGSLGLGDTQRTTTVTASDYGQVPDNFVLSSEVSPIESISADVGGCINVRFNNIPYVLSSTDNVNSVETLGNSHFQFYVGYVAYGGETLNGQFVRLTLGTDYTINSYNSDTKTFTALEEPTVQINGNTYDSSDGQNKLYFILSKNTTYKIMKVAYYISDRSNQYVNTPSSSDPTIIAIFDYTNAPTGIVETRIFNLGNWQIRSDAAGNLLFEFLGSAPNDNFVNRVYQLTPTLLSEDNTARTIRSTLNND